MNLREAAERIARKAERLGWAVRRDVAGNGRIIYLFCEREQGEDNDLIGLTIRVADDAECCPPRPGERTISVSPQEHEAGYAYASQVLAHPEMVPGQ